MESILFIGSWPYTIKFLLLSRIAIGRTILQVLPNLCAFSCRLLLHRPHKDELPLIDESIARGLEIIPMLIKGEFAEATTKLHTIAK